MKKLVTAACALAAGIAMADVVSTNIVGYTDSVYAMGADLYCSAFAPMGGDMTLGDILPNADFDPDGGNHIILFEGGMAVATLTYMDADQVAWYLSDNGVQLTVGWYDQSKFIDWDGTLTPADNMNDYPLGPGVAFMLNAGPIRALSFHPHSKQTNPKGVLQ